MKDVIEYRGYKIKKTSNGLFWYVENDGRLRDKIDECREIIDELINDAFKEYMENQTTKP